MPLEQGRGSAVDFASPCVRVIGRINQEAVGDRKLDRLMGAWRPSMVEQEIHLGESLVRKMDADGRRLSAADYRRCWGAALPMSDRSVAKSREDLTRGDEKVTMMVGRDIWGRVCV
jgi:hypothetical protein